MLKKGLLGGDTLASKKVMIIGTVPPPKGGVTIHVLRLLEGLKAQQYHVDFLDFRKKDNKNPLVSFQYLKSLVTLMQSKHTEVVHYQLNHLLELYGILFLARLKKWRLISTVHSFRPEVMGPMKQWIFRRLAKSRIEFIAPSRSIKEALTAYGVKERQVTELHPFLPPSETERNEELPKEVLALLQSKKKKIVANASRLYKDALEVDVYGLDMCIEACKEIPDVTFLFCVPLIGDEDYYEACKRKIQAYGLAERFFILMGDLPFVSLLKHAHLLVRPTSTDSYGISVAEALFLGVPALASDVCERTEGTVLFKSRDQKDFNDQIQSILSSGPSRNTVLSTVDCTSYIAFYERAST